MANPHHGGRGIPLNREGGEGHLLMVLIDALRHDQVTPERTPFLWHMSQRGTRLATQEVFAGQLRPAFFAGLYPNQSGVGHLFCYDPENSPFRGAELVPPLLERSRRLSWRIRRRIAETAKKREIKRGHRGSASYCYLAEIPTRLLPYFAFSETPLPWEQNCFPRPGLLQILTHQSIPWLHLGYPVVDQRTAPLTEAVLTRMRPAHRFLFFHYAELDWAGHTHGPSSPQAYDALARIDGDLELIWDKASSLFAKPRLLAFGDHGMVEVTKSVDVESALLGLSAKQGSDYCVFLDSTVARFWFHQQHAEQEILARFAQLPGGRWLSMEEMKELHVAGGLRENGEAFWLVDPGTVILPCYFQRTHKPAGMHGYHPSVRDNWGAVVSSEDLHRTDQVISLTEIFSIALDLLGLDDLPPTDMKKT